MGDQVIIKKVDGITKSSKRVIMVNKKRYLTESEACFNSVVNPKKDKIDKKVAIEIYGDVSKMAVKFSNGKEHSTLSAVMLLLKNTKNISDFKRIIQMITFQYENEIRDIRNKNDFISNNVSARLNYNYKEYPEFTASILTKKFVTAYYTQKLSGLSKKELNDLDDARITGASIDDLLVMLGEKFNDVSIENGIYNFSKKVLNDSLDIVLDRVNHDHLCWMNCINASPNNCLKFVSQRKMEIDKYDFITDGYQLLDEKGLVEKFVVTGCKNYKRNKNEYTDPNEARRLKESIRTAYFNAIDLEESYVIENDLIEREQAKVKTMDIPHKEQK